MSLVTLMVGVALLLGISPSSLVISGSSTATRVVYAACLLIASVSVAAAVAGLVAGPASGQGLTLPLGLPCRALTFASTALSSFFLVVANLGGAAASLFAHLLRLLRKKVVLARNASWLFRTAPYLIFAATWVAAALVPTFATGLLFSWSADLIAIAALLGSGRFFLALAGLDARKHGCHTVRIDVEGQEGQGFIAGVSPLVHKAVRFKNQRSRSPCRCLAVNRVRPSARDDVIESRSCELAIGLEIHHRPSGEIGSFLSECEIHHPLDQAAIVQCQQDRRLATDSSSPGADCRSSQYRMPQRSADGPGRSLDLILGCSEHPPVDDSRRVNCIGTCVKVDGPRVWKDDEEAARWFRLAAGEKVESRVGIGR